MITKEQKATLVADHGNTPEDTGKPEVQISIFTSRINDITHHLEGHAKDHAGRRGLIKLVSKRRRLLNFLIKTDITRYRKIVADLKLRK